MVLKSAKLKEKHSILNKYCIYVLQDRIKFFQINLSLLLAYLLLGTHTFVFCLCTPCLFSIHINALALFVWLFLNKVLMTDIYRFAPTSAACFPISFKETLSVSTKNERTFIPNFAVKIPVHFHFDTGHFVTYLKAASVIA